LNVVLDCIPCYLKQTMNTLSQTKLSEDKARNILYEVLTMIPQLDPEGTPAENSTRILWKVNEFLGTHDPFAKAKRESNKLALNLLPHLRERILKSHDPLYTAFQVSVAGNIIDMGIIKEFNIEESLQEALEKKFARDDYQSFKTKLRNAQNVIILGDNSGEIAFDKLLAEQLRQYGAKITYVVKETPILNDATQDDANYVCMKDVADVMSNGSGYLGTVIRDCSNEFRTAFRKADLIISKGQANYESLESSGEAGEKTYFLLRAKCEVVAKSLGVKLGEMAFCKNTINMKV
jgi:damage-control phosphatase, subfamily I